MPVKEFKSIIISLSKELKKNIAIMNEQRDWLYKNQTYCLSLDIQYKVFKEAD